MLKLAQASRPRVGLGKPDVKQAIRRVLIGSLWYEAQDLKRYQLQAENPLSDEEVRSTATIIAEIADRLDIQF